MKIVSFSYNYSPNFTSPDNWFKRTALYHGSLEILAKKHQVISVKQIAWSGKTNYNGVEHYFTDFGSNKFLFIYRINCLIKSLKPDLMLLQGLHHPLAFLHLSYLMPKGTKIIAQHHAEKPSQTLKRHFQKLADKRIDAYIFASKSLGENWLNDGIISSIIKIHEVMEVSSSFYPINRKDALQKTSAAGNPVFLWVGRLNQNKDPLTVIKGFLKFAEVDTSARLYMIYQTEELLLEIESILTDNLNRSSVILIGKVANEELLYWYNSADFILSGSHYEGSGTAICEAMSCGCIPVLTNIASFQMITNNGECGMLYNAGDAEGLYNALKETQRLDIPTNRQKCLARFEEKLSFKAIARDIEAVANSIIK